MLALGAASLLAAADDQRLALVTKAEAAFDKVQLVAAPDLRDASQCVQAEAALLPVATPDELPIVHFRKGYCMLASAVLQRDAGEFKAAAGEFDSAMTTWAARPVSKNKPAEPLPSNLLVLSALARLHADQEEARDLARNSIATALAGPQCSSRLMPIASCDAVMRAGRDWLGWLAFRNGDLDQAEKQFTGSPGTGWPEWISGMQAFRRGNYRTAVSDYRRAIELMHPGVEQSLLRRLGPPSDQPAELTELGGAQFLAGDASGAIATLDSAAKLQPSNARAIFLRAVAREAAGQRDPALADYNLASRTAFANSRDLASGEAHLYRGILFYKRADYSHAEDEFASALNFTIAADMRADAVAWRHLAAVATGSCEASRQLLTRSLGSVSPYFPRDEAQSRVAACSSAAVPPQAADAAGK